MGRLVPAGWSVVYFTVVSDQFEAARGKALMKQGMRRPLGRFSILIFAAAALQILLRVSLGVPGDGGALLLILQLYVLLPVLSILLPFWAGRGGVHPFAAFFPLGGAALIFSAAPGWLCFVCMLLSLVACVAGQEWTKRTETEKTETEKKKSHGGRNQKR